MNAGKFAKMVSTAFQYRPHVIGMNQRNRMPPFQGGFVQPARGMIIESTHADDADVHFKSLIQHMRRYPNPQFFAGALAIKGSDKLGIIAQGHFLGPFVVGPDNGEELFGAYACGKAF